MKHVSRDPPFRKDGELWTGVCGGVVAGLWLGTHPGMFPKAREHFGDLPNITGITFGFALTALFFHVEAIGTWRDHPIVRKIAKRLITTHVWTIARLLAQIGFILSLWTIDQNVSAFHRWVRATLYGLLTFSTIYCGRRILNHALTAWWAFDRRDKLAGDPGDANKTLAGHHARPKADVDI